METNQEMEEDNLGKMMMNPCSPRRKTEEVCKKVKKEDNIHREKTTGRNKKEELGRICHSQVQPN